jgi:rhamnogalacturonan endolyase
MKQHALSSRWLPLMAGLLLVPGLAAQAAETAEPVTLTESDRTFFLDNGILNVRIEKATGEIFSIKYQGQEMLAQDSSGGALGGYWSSVGRARGGSEQSAVVRINPKDNKGERVEVSCNFHNAPNAATNSPLDVDVRYSLGRGESWVYTYLIWSHKSGYPAFGVGEARYAVKLNPTVFDYMTIDKDRRRQMPSPADWDAGSPLNLKEARRMTTGIHKGEAEHKYDYSALIYDIPAYGWSSTKHNLGFWFINPSFEYMAGGPTKAELTGHLDVNPGGTPTLLNMWLGSHYGGSSLAVGENEDWTKLVGPFAIYCNTASSHDAMWHDALNRARTEAGTWPYHWLSDPNYPSEEQRSTVSGQIVLRDPLDSGLKVSNLWVGLTAPNYVPPRVGGGNTGRRSNTNAPADGSTNAPGANTNTFRGGFPPEVDWQRDAKFYQFWITASPNGKFTIPNVRPGSYTLRAIADGVIGEFAVTNVTIGTGETKSLGAITWTPARYGRTLWQVGVPDRTAGEFRHGDHYWQWGLYFNYAKEFTNDVDYIIGRSDWRKDWNYVQPPRIMTQNLSVVGEDDGTAEQMAQFVRSAGREVQSTTWSIKFGLSQKPRGTATLRLAFCGTHASCNVEAFVNDKSIGDTGALPSTSAMQRDGIRAFWIEKPLHFDAALLRGGVNSIKLKSHANTWSQGVMYDVVRLELNEPAP